MNSETIRFEPSRFRRIHFESNPKSDDAPKRVFMLSPYDTPEAVVISEDDEQYRLKIRYMFEPTSEQRCENLQEGCRIYVDPVSGRINSVTVDKSSAHGQRLAEFLHILARHAAIAVPDSNFIEGGPPRSLQFRRAVLPIVLEEAAVTLKERRRGNL